MEASKIATIKNGRYRRKKVIINAAVDKSGNDRNHTIANKTTKWFEAKFSPIATPNAMYQELKPG